MVYVVIDSRTETAIAVYRTRREAEEMCARLSNNYCRVDERPIAA